MVPNNNVPKENVDSAVSPLASLRSVPATTATPVGTSDFVVPSAAISIFDAAPPATKTSSTSNAPVSQKRVSER
jgi:hypothetical protein